MPGRVSASSGTGARLRVAVLGEVGAVPVPVSRVSPPHRSVAERTPAFRCGVWGGVPAYSPSGCAVAVRGGAGGARTQRGVRARGPLEASFDFFFFPIFYLPSALFVYFHYPHELRTPPALLSGFPPQTPPTPLPAPGAQQHRFPPSLPPARAPPGAAAFPAALRGLWAALGPLLGAVGLRGAPRGEVRRDAKRRARSGGADRVQLCPPGPSESRVWLCRSGALSHAPARVDARCPGDTLSCAGSGGNRGAALRSGLQPGWCADGP